jgi:hypothetical protein
MRLVRLHQIRSNLSLGLPRCIRAEKEIVVQLKPIRLVVTLALVILTVPLASDAQPPGKSRRVGILTAVTAPTMEPLHALLRQELRERGYMEG